MLIDFEHALSVFEEMPVSLQLPSFHPSYLLADAIRENPSTKPLFFLYEKSSAIFYLPFLYSPVLQTPYYDIQSPYGYGGPLCTTDNEFFLKEAYAEFRKWCEENAVLAEFIRFHPLARNERGYDGEVLFNRETVWLDLPAEHYETRVRTAIRKAEKHLTIHFHEHEESLDLFKSIYFQGMKEIGASDFYFFKDAYFDAFKTWKDVFCLFAYAEDRCVAASMFLKKGEYMEYHLSACLKEGRSYSATNALLHHAALRGKSEGAKIFHLGGGVSTSPEDKLLFFKAGFSPLRSRFSIGKKIVNTPAYEALKAEWIKTHGDLAKTILFYR